MGTSKRLAALYDLYADVRALERISKTGPLQSLTPEELELDRMPVTTYPKPQGVRAWVRFGPQHVRVGASLMRTTETAAGIEFTIGEKTYRCWVWGNAVTMVADDRATTPSTASR